MNPHEIKSLRKEKNLSQQEMGDICGVTKTSVSRWEKDKAKPSGSALIRLEELRDGKVVVSDLSPLEHKLLAQNVEAGGFKNNEDFLIESLRHLLSNNGSFMSIAPDNITQIPKKKAHLAAAAGSGIEADLIDWVEGSPELNVRVAGLSMVPMFQDDEVVTMAPRHLAKRSQELAKGKIYLFRVDGQLKARASDNVEYLTKTGTVGQMVSINPDFPPIDITDQFTEIEWIAWLEKDGSFPKRLK